MRPRSFSYLVASAIIAGCGGDSSGPARVDSIEISGAPATILTGQSVQLAARAFDGSQTEIKGRAITWSSTTPEIARVNQSGLVTGLAVGPAQISATADGITGTVALSVRPVPVATVDVSPAAAGTRAGGTYQLTVVARDSIGNPLLDRTVSWTSRDTTIASVSANGLVSGHSIGATVIVATIEGKRDSVDFTVTPANAPQITSITPALLLPGITAIISGVNFDPNPGANEVVVGGTRVSVVSASAQRLEVALPTSGFACAPTNAATVSVTIDGLQATLAHPLQVATQRALDVGQTLMLSASAGRCNELGRTGGRYLISVHNTESTLSQTTVELRGTSATAPVASAAVPLIVGEGAMTAAPRSMGGFNVVTPQRHLRADDLHYRLLDESRRIAERPEARRTSRSAPVRLSVSGAPNAVTSTSTPVVGSVLSLKIANLNAPAGTIACSQPLSVRARVVHVGERSIVLEDETAPLARTMDTYYERIGREFDERMYPVLEQHFGNPFAYASALDNDTRLMMLFSPRVNEFEGIAGFVYGCDFFAPTPGDTILRASNQAEVFYARVPTVAGSGYSGDTKDNWLWSIRSTVVHEVKHIISYAERFSRTPAGQQVRLEQSWLEEGTARHSEELYARTYSGATWKGNVTHAQTVFCEVRPTGIAGCDSERPLSLMRHFGSSGLYSYYTQSDTRSPLGRSAEKDNSFYGSAWLLVRWAIDHFASTERDFLRGLTQDYTRTGVANLEARTGRLWAELIPEWSLALALDDHPAQPRVDARLSIPSFNTRDIFAGMSSDFPTTYPQAFPLAVRSQTYGAFRSEMAIQAGSSGFVELSGAQWAQQLLELRTLSGGVAPSHIRMSIVRVQ